MDNNPDITQQNLSDFKPPPHDESYRNIGIIVGIVIFLLLFAFIIIAFIAFGISDPVTTPSTPPVETGEFLSPCTTTSCQPSLVCDGINFTCKFGTGSVCNDFTDCVTGLICSGLCATGAVGGLNELCPCDSGYLCVPIQGGLTVCKGIGGTNCGTGADCVSFICEGGICATGAPNSFPCTINETCASQNCSIGFCQPQGVITGSQGAACAGECFGQGITGAVCSSGTGMVPLTCVCLDGSNNPGTCVVANQGILTTCSPMSACGNGLECLDIDANTCTGGSPSCTGCACICVFPYDNPNAQAAGICIAGMTAGINDLCVNDPGLGCDSGGLCFGNSCNGNSVMSIYQFIGNTGGNTGSIYTTGVLFAGATETNILFGFTGPTGIITPYKMFATSNSSVDTIYLIDYTQGLLTVQYNVGSGSASAWTQLLPYTNTTTIGGVTTTKTLIDASFNNNTFIVSFQETVTGGGTGAVTGTNDTVYTGSSINNLAPFNVLSGGQFTGLPGTQYTSGGVALSIDYIDISPANDVSSGGDTLISINGTIYVKQQSDTTYNIGVIAGGPLNGQQMTGLTGPARFYFDVIENSGAPGSPVCPEPGTGDSPVQCPSVNNIAFVGPFQSFSGTEPPEMYDQVLQFSGNIAGVGQPNDRFTGNTVQYHVFDFSIFSPTGGIAGASGISGMPGSTITMLVDAYVGSTFISTMVAASNSGTTTVFPYRIGPTARSVATNNNLYILSIASCG
ncbi:Hypothetical protein HVR_LOCUS676 [uncultured virus]|nr:Hypothetical protein HVR_LOCUS676 [uncultured virus]